MSKTVEIPTNDKPSARGQVDRVEPSDGGWVISRDGWCLHVPDDKCSTPPGVGETIELYGRGIGYTVRGIVIGGRVYRYLTEEQDNQRHRDEVEASKKERREKLEAERADRDRRVAALPPAFRARLERFHAVGGDAWRAEFEPYELFVCEEAVKLVEYARKAGIEDISQRVTVEAVLDNARGAVSENLLREALGATYEEHSGNTMASAVGLANAALKNRPLEKLHGALCSLVGCADYKCWHAGGSES